MPDQPEMPEQQAQPKQEGNSEADAILKLTGSIASTLDQIATRLMAPKAWWVRIRENAPIVAAFAAVAAVLVASNNTTRTLTSNNRAYVYFGGMTWRHAVNEQGQNVFIVDLEIGNTGNTPTRRLMYAVTCADGWRKDKLDAESQRSTLAARQTFFVTACKPLKNPPPLQDFYVIARATYFDTLDPNLSIHITESCHKITKLAAVPDAVGTVLTQQSVPCLEGHNCQDEDCDATAWHQ